MGVPYSTFSVRGYRAGRTVEASFEQAKEQLGAKIKQVQQQAQEGGGQEQSPDPEKAAKAQQIAQETQFDGQKGKMALQAEQRKQGAEARKEQLEIQILEVELATKQAVLAQKRNEIIAAPRSRRRRNSEARNMPAGRTTYVIRNGKAVEKSKAVPLQTGPRLQIIRDTFKPGRSPVDDTIIDSMSALKRHNDRNGVVDVGDDPAFKNPKRPENKMPDPTPMLNELLGDWPN